MGLQIEAVDRIFLRLSSTYGAEWDRLWDSQPIGNVKAVWAHELAGFSGQLECIAWALENLPDQPPNAIRFRNLCRLAPAPQAPRLDTPVANRARVAAALDKLKPLRAALAMRRGNKEWANDIVTRHLAGEKLKPIQLQLARSALRLPEGSDGEG